MIEKRPRRRDGILVAIAVFVLWLILDGEHSVASLFAGCAVALALGAWVPAAAL